MKRQQVYLLLGAALVLAIAGTIFQIVWSSGWKGQATDLEPFAKLPVNSVEKLVQSAPMLQLIKLLRCIAR